MVTPETIRPHRYPRQLRSLHQLRDLPFGLHRFLHHYPQVFLRVSPAASPARPHRSLRNPPASPAPAGPLSLTSPQENQQCHLRVSPMSHQRRGLLEAPQSHPPRDLRCNPLHPLLSLVHDQAVLLAGNPRHYQALYEPLRLDPVLRCLITQQKLQQPQVEVLALKSQFM